MLEAEDDISTANRISIVYFNSNVEFALEKLQKH